MAENLNKIKGENKNGLEAFLDRDNHNFALENRAEENGETSRVQADLSSGFFAKVGQSKSSAKTERFRIWMPKPYWVYFNTMGAGKEKLEKEVMPAYFNQVVDYLMMMSKLDNDLIKYSQWLEKDDIQRGRDRIDIEHNPENLYHCTLIGQYALVSLIVQDHKKSMDKPTQNKAVALKIKARKLVKEAAYGAIPGLNPKIKAKPEKMETYVKNRTTDTNIDQCINDAANVFNTRFRMLDELLTEAHKTDIKRERMFFTRAIFDEQYRGYMQRMEYLLGLEGAIKQKGSYISPFAEMTKYVDEIKTMFPQEFDFKIQNGRSQK